MEKDDKLYCDGCGKCLTHKTADGEERSFAELCIAFHGKNEFVANQLGKYDTGEENQEWNFCAECWLDSLMGFGRK